MSIIVALHGLPRVGKDTLAKHLIQAYGYQRVAFADALYEELGECYELDSELLKSHEWKTVPQDALQIWKAKDPEFRRVMRLAGHDMFEPQTSRTIARYYATEYRRDASRGYWLAKINWAFHAPHALTPKVITDLRFPDECGHLRAWASQLAQRFTVIEITKEGSVRSEHRSDMRLDDAIDISIENRQGEPELMFIAAARHIRKIVTGD